MVSFVRMIIFSDNLLWHDPGDSTHNVSQIFDQMAIICFLSLNGKVEGVHKVNSAFCRGARLLQKVMQGLFSCMFT